MITDKQRILVHYVGTFLDGKQFDSSRDRGRPYSFEVGSGRVIKCWDLGMKQLRMGDKATFNCPPEVAYGSKGNRNIPPNSTIQFDVEVVDAKPFGWKPSAPITKVGKTLPQYKGIDTNKFRVEVYQENKGL